MYQRPPLIRSFKELLVPLDLTYLLWNRRKVHMHKGQLAAIPTIVLPGLGASDRATKPLRHYLTVTGLKVYKGGIGRNHGNLKQLIPLAEQQLEFVYKKHRQPVVLIGWSLGGIIARELARTYPQYCVAVCCMGSPIVGGGKYSAFAPLYKRYGFDLKQMEEACTRRESNPISVPSLSIYSKKDGIVFWRASQDPYNEHTEHLEVRCRHFAMGFSLQVYQALFVWLKKTLPTSRE